MITLKALVPKRFIDAKVVEATSLRALNAFADDVVSQMAKYPPAQPWKSRTPKSGLRRGGKRTGNLGRGWRKVNRSKGTLDIVNLTPYAVWVEGPKEGNGPRQTRVMRNRGWQSITDVGRAAAKKHRPALIRAVIGQA